MVKNVQKLKMFFKILFVFTVICRSFCGEPGEKKWNYSPLSAEGPANWAKDYPQCGGRHQSPINIDPSQTDYDKDLRPLKLFNYSVPVQGMEYILENNGHSMVAHPKFEGNTPILLEFKGHNYRFVQFHFHWGLHDVRGSEHKINVKSYSAELHLVHHNTKYPDFKASLKKADGLLVWAHFFQVQNDVLNSGIERLQEHFNKISYAGENYTMDGKNFSLTQLFSDTLFDRYYNYHGSLTTPGCFESVTWVVNDNMSNMTSRQIELFRQLYANKRGTNLVTIVDNFRPLQNVNGRTIRRSFDGSTSSSMKVIASIELIHAICFIYFVLLIP